MGQTDTDGQSQSENTTAHIQWAAYPGIEPESYNTGACVSFMYMRVCAT